MIKELCHDEAILSQRCEVATVEVTKSTRYIKCKVAFDQIVDGKMKECRRDYAGFEAQMIQHMIDHCLGKLV